MKRLLNLIVEMCWLTGAIMTAVVEYANYGLYWAVIGFFVWPWFVLTWVYKGWLQFYLRSHGVIP